jgi:hypothetical protein
LSATVLVDLFFDLFKNPQVITGSLASEYNLEMAIFKTFIMGHDEHTFDPLVLSGSVNRRS